MLIDRIHIYENRDIMDIIFGPDVDPLDYTETRTRSYNYLNPGPIFIYLEIQNPENLWTAAQYEDRRIVDTLRNLSSDFFVAFAVTNPANQDLYSEFVDYFVQVLTQLGKRTTVKQVKSKSQALEWLCKVPAPSCNLELGELIVTLHITREKCVFETNPEIRSNPNPRLLYEKFFEIVGTEDELLVLSSRDSYSALEDEVLSKGLADAIVSKTNWKRIVGHFLVTAPNRKRTLELSNELMYAVTSKGLNVEHSLYYDRNLALSRLLSYPTLEKPKD